MNRKQAAIIFCIIMAISSSVMFFSSCSNKLSEGFVIFTQVNGKTQDINNLKTDSWRYNLQSRIAVIDPSDPQKTFRILTPDFYTALSPRISFDGKFMLFSARKNENDTWQIWEMNLENLQVRPITREKDNCIDPAYLPGRQIVFTRIMVNAPAQAGYELITCNTDGTKLQKITYDFREYSSSTVLKDGRVLAISRQTYPDLKKAVLMILRPDGTKANLFYNGPEENTLIGPACEMSDGKILFIETGINNKSAGELISIRYNRPLHSRISFSSGIKGSFQSVTSMNSGKLLVSFRPSSAGKYSLYEFDPEKMIMGDPIYSSSEFDALEAVVVENRERPKKLPSEVDPGVKTGLLLCQDINFTGIPSEVKTISSLKADRIEIIGADSSLGIIQSEKDGSFYLKVIADTPFRIRTLDEKGNILNETCDWIYLRPNERRGCIGCHEDHEMVPENRLPLAVKRDPFLIPVHKTKLEEKVIELE